MTSRPRSLVLILTFLLISSPLLEAWPGSSVSPVGMMATSGVVRVNGVPVSASQTLFTGDVVETEGASSGLLQIAPDGVARFTAAAKASVARRGEAVALQLENGYVAVRQGNLPIGVQAKGGWISAERGSVFEVAQVKGKTYITASKGDAVISDGGLASPHIVRQGQTVQVAFLDPGQEPAAQAANPPQAEAATACEKCKADCAQAGGSNCEKKCANQCKKQKQPKKAKGKGAAGGGAAAGGAAAGGVAPVTAAVTAGVIAGAAAAIAVPVAIAATSQAERTATITVRVSPSGVSAAPK